MAKIDMKNPEATNIHNAAELKKIMDEKPAKIFVIDIDGVLFSPSISEEPLNKLIEMVLNSEIHFSVFEIEEILGVTRIEIKGKNMAIITRVLASEHIKHVIEKAIKMGYLLVLLTNQPLEIALKSQLALKLQLNLTELFTISSFFNEKKQYLRKLAEMDSVEKIIFIDDNPDNIAGANSLDVGNLTNILMREPSRFNLGVPTTWWDKLGTIFEMEG